MRRAAWRWVASFFFVGQMYAVMVLMGLVLTPLVLVRRDAAFAACRSYCRWVRWSARRMVGLRSEIRGEVPAGEVLIAAKHQSFFDIILIVSVLPRPKFIMKKELLRAPIVGFYATRMGCVPVDRGRRGQAIRDMVARVRDGQARPGQLVIFPQGTRVAAGAHLPYKPGAAILYRELGQACVPAATNVGVFWPRHGLMRHPGLAVLEFLPAIGPGAPAPGFLAAIETAIEHASDRLMAEAVFAVPPRAPDDAAPDPPPDPPPDPAESPAPAGRG